MEGGLSPSAAAAIAADLERAIYGKVSDEPVVFVRYSKEQVVIKDFKWCFISSRGREWNILAWPWNSNWNCLCYLTQKEAALIWNKESGVEEESED